MSRGAAKLFGQVDFSTNGLTTSHHGYITMKLYSQCQKLPAECSPRSGTASGSAWLVGASAAVVSVTADLFVHACRRPNGSTRRRIHDPFHLPIAGLGNRDTLHELKIWGHLEKCLSYTQGILISKRQRAFAHDPVHRHLLTPWRFNPALCTTPAIARHASSKSTSRSDPPPRRDS